MSMLSFFKNDSNTRKVIMFRKAIKDLRAAMLMNTKEFFESNDFDTGSYDWRFVRDYRTIHVGAGQRMGRTAWALATLEPQDIMVVGTLAERELLIKSKPNCQVITLFSTDAPRTILVNSKIVVDVPDMLLTPDILTKVYQDLAKHPEQEFYILH